MLQNDEAEKQKKKKQSLFKNIRDIMKPEKLIISQQSRWKAIFDTTIIAVIAYSCFTTVYYVAFDATQSESAKNKDMVVTVFFSFDFFFNMA